MTFCTKNPVNIQTLRTITVPEETETYKPVGHDWLALQVKEIGTAYLGECLSSGYGTSKDGQQLFGLHTFKSSITDDQTIALGFRNSYDKSLPVGIVGGSSVLVCDNMCLWGDVKRIRKHTGNVIEDINKILINLASGLGETFEAFNKFAEGMMKIEVSDDDAYKFLGLARGYEALRHQHFSRALKEWNTPVHDEWLGRNAWSLYNACTEALKGSRQDEVAERHLKLTQLASQEFSLAQSGPASSDRFAMLEM
jgi:hypothetical protein